ncbi:MAG: hypothetical protein NTV01_01850, partial [Bacteroidia bacterium]|nr:hypothetical protein [Bacteroidia bacterium]
MSSLMEYMSSNFTKVYTTILDRIGWTYTDSGYGSSIKVNCERHGSDNVASLSINTDDGVWKCFGCNEGGGVIQFYSWIYGVKPTEAYEGLEVLLGVNPRVPVEDIRKAHDRLLQDEKLIAWLKEERCITYNTLFHYKIGFDGQRLILPEFDYAGVLRQIIRHLPAYTRNQPGFTGSSIKSFSDVTGMGARLWPFEAFSNFNSTTLIPNSYTDLWLFEGWLDALLARQNGLNAVSVTNAGCHGWNKSFDCKFEGKTVYICYDVDPAGESAARARALHLTAVAKEVFLVKLPPEGLPEKGDFTDFVKIHGFEKFLLIEPVPYVQADQDTHVVNDVHLAESDNPLFFKQHIRAAVTVLGKGRIDLVPKKFRVKCRYTGGQDCLKCPMAPTAVEGTIPPGAERELIGTILADDPILLQMPGETEIKVINLVAIRAGMIRKDNKGKKIECALFRIIIEEVWKLEELMVIPSIGWEPSGDAQYVNRTIHYVGSDSIISNHNYKMTGIAIPHPKDQRAAWVTYKAEPEKDKLSDFIVNDSNKEELVLFQPVKTDECITAPTDSDLGNMKSRFWEQPALEGMRLKEAELHADYMAVTKTVGRNSLFDAIDYAYHSVLNFSFRGAPVRRGHVNFLCVGDTRTAKSETADILASHFKAGRKVDCANLSFAGLVGGVQKIGEQWSITWGALPREDKGLLVMDEMHKVSDEGMMGQLSETISSGVIKITKMATEQTRARCRLIMLANPKEERSLEHSQYGCLAIPPIVN